MSSRAVGCTAPMNCTACSRPMCTGKHISLVDFSGMARLGRSCWSDSLRGYPLGFGRNREGQSGLVPGPDVEEILEDEAEDELRKRTFSAG